MKRNYNDMTDAELLALTPEVIQSIVDRECAERGIPIPELPTSVVPKAPALPAPDVSAFKISEFTLNDAGAAAVVMAAINSVAGNVIRLDYNYRTSDQKKALPVEPDGPYFPKIETRTAYSPEVYDRIAPAMEEYGELKKRAEAELKEYNAARDKTQAIRKEIDELIGAAQARKYNRDRFRAVAAKYLGVAEGDRVNAARFMFLAYEGAIRDVLEEADALSSDAGEQAKQIADYIKDRVEEAKNEIREAGKQ